MLLKSNKLITFKRRNKPIMQLKSKLRKSNTRKKKRSQNHQKKLKTMDGLLSVERRNDFKTATIRSDLFKPYLL